MSAPNLPPSSTPGDEAQPANPPTPPPPTTDPGAEPGRVRQPASPPWARKYITRPSQPTSATPTANERPSAEEGSRSTPPPLPPALRLASPLPTAPPDSPSAGDRPGAAPERRRSAGRTGLTRFLMLAICFGSIVLVLWSLFDRLQPVSREHQDKIAEVSRLAEEVEQLRRKWNPEEMERTRGRYRAAQKILFTGAAELSEWEKQTAIQSASMMLETVFEAGSLEAHPQAGLNLESVHADLRIQPTIPTGLTNSPFAQVLGFVDHVAKSPKRVDLLELSVDGDTNSVALARVRLQLLAQEDAGAPPATTGSHRAE